MLCFNFNNYFFSATAAYLNSISSYAYWSSFLNSLRVYGVKRSRSSFRAWMYYNCLSLFRRKGKFIIAFAFFWNVSSRMSSSREGLISGSFWSILCVICCKSSLISELFCFTSYSVQTFLFNSSFVWAGNGCFRVKISWSMIPMAQTSPALEYCLLVHISGER